MQVIHLHVQAPDKPATGEACNGCGVCCASEPCPLGMIASRKRTGRCNALHWSDEASRYYCGLIVQPQAHLPRGLGWLGPFLSRLARRYIAAGIGCDSTLVAERKPEQGTSASA